MFVSLRTLQFTLRQMDTYFILIPDPNPPVRMHYIIGCWINLHCWSKQTFQTKHDNYIVKPLFLYLISDVCQESIIIFDPDLLEVIIAICCGIIMKLLQSKNICKETRLFRLVCIWSNDIYISHHLSFVTILIKMPTNIKIKFYLFEGHANYRWMFKLVFCNLYMM